MQFDVQWNIVNSTAGSSSYVSACGICVFTSTTPTGDVYQTTFTTNTASTGTLSTSPHQYDGWTLVRTRTAGSTTVQSYTVIVSHTGTSAPVFTYATPLDSACIASDIITLIPPFALQRGGGQNFIKRLRVLYGSLVLEDILEYKTLVRMFFEAGVNPSFVKNSGSILEGMYGTRLTETNATVSQNEMNNAYQVYVAGSTAITTAEVMTGRQVGIAGPMQGQMINQLQCAPAVDSAGAVVALGSLGADQFEGRYTYCINLLSGLFTQKKLIPLKWMAAQLAIEITLSDASDCVLSNTATNQLTYQWSNVNFIGELLEFDSSYDDAFYEGLRMGGVPLKFDTFHYHSFSLSGSYNVPQIHERARSIKAAYAVIRDTNTPSVVYDSDKLYFSVGESYNTSTGVVTNASVGSVTQFQWRVGGRY